MKISTNKKNVLNSVHLFCIEPLLISCLQDVSNEKEKKKKDEIENGINRDHSSTMQCISGTIRETSEEAFRAIN